MAHRSIGCVSLLFSLALVLLASPSFAQVLGNSGDAVFGAERLFGIRNERLSIDDPDVESKSTTISVGLADALLPQNVARLSFDYLAARKFSVGGAIGYSSSDLEGPGDLAAFDGDAKTFLFVGRVGFLHMFGRVLGIWPRGGVTYHSTSVDGGSELSDFGLTLECMFPIVVAPHFGFLTGLSFDQSLTGNFEPPVGPESDLEYRSIGWQFGLFGWL